MMHPRNHFGRIQQIASPQGALFHLEKFQLIKTWIRSLTRRFNRAARSKKVVWGSISFQNKGSKNMWRIRAYTSGSKRNVSHPKTMPWSHLSWKSLTRELTYPTWGKGKSSSKVPWKRDMLVPWRVYIHTIFTFHSFESIVAVHSCYTWSFTKWWDKSVVHSSLTPFLHAPTVRTLPVFFGEVDLWFRWAALGCATKDGSMFAVSMKTVEENLSQKATKIASCAFL